MPKSVFSSENPTYYGPERRKAERRNAVDRRQYIRIDDQEHEDRRKDGRRDSDIHDQWFESDLN